MRCLLKSAFVLFCGCSASSTPVDPVSSPRTAGTCTAGPCTASTYAEGSDPGEDPAELENTESPANGSEAIDWPPPKPLEPVECRSPLEICGTAIDRFTYTLFCESPPPHELRQLRCVKQLETLVVRDPGLSVEDVRYANKLRGLTIEERSNEGPEPGPEALYPRRLKALPSLDDLGLAGFGLIGTGVSHLERLRDLKLKEVGLTATLIVDLGPIASEHLESLRLERGRVSSLEPLRTATRLRKFALSHVPISDLSPLEDTSALQEVLIEGTPISDISALAHSPELHQLWLRDTEVSSLKSLAPLTKLRTIDFERTPIDSLEGLEDQPELTRVSISDAPLHNIEALAGASKLFVVAIRSTQLKNLTPLEHHSELVTLHLDRNPITNLKPLATLAALQRLSLVETPVENLEGLQGLHQLKSLDLTGTKVRDLTPLSKLQALESLTLDRTPVTDLDHILNLPMLKYVGVRGTNVPAATLAQLKANYPKIRFRS